MFRIKVHAVLVALGLAVVGLSYAPSVSALEASCQSFNKDQCDLVTTDKSNDLSSKVWSIVSMALGILGGIAVIVVIIGGIMYATSSGDSAKLTAAKNTILYAAIGMVVAFLAATIITLVNNYFGKL